MPRITQFERSYPTIRERRTARMLCAGLLEAIRLRRGEFARISAALSPIEPTLLCPLLTDVAHGDGYDHSPLALLIDRKGYYRRKRHLLWCLPRRFPDLWCCTQDRLTNGGQSNG